MTLGHMWKKSQRQSRGVAIVASSRGACSFGGLSMCWQGSRTPHRAYNCTRTKDPKSVTKAKAKAAEAVGHPAPRANDMQTCHLFHIGDTTRMFFSVLSLQTFNGTLTHLYNEVHGSFLLFRLWLSGGIHHNIPTLLQSRSLRGTSVRPLTGR